MPRNVYYGDCGEYGPYTPREYGLPDAGEVLEDFRCIKLMSVQEFVTAYNKEVAEYNEKQKRKMQRQRHLPTITRNLVYKWEKHNMVPTDPERRRLIANILNLPLALFGIVTAEEILFRPMLKAAPATISNQTVDLLPYEENIRTIWRFFYASTAQSEEYTLIKAIKELESYEQQFKGNLQRNIREMLYSHYLLLANILRDQRHYSQAYNHANNGVRVAKSMLKDARNKAEELEMSRLIARAQYTRGCMKLVWGQYGFQDEHRRFNQNPAYIQDAIDDFEEAAKQATPVLKGSLYKELARAQSFKQKNETNITLALDTLRMAEAYIGMTSEKDDPYMQILHDGNLGGLNEGTYLLGSAILFNAVKRPGKALEALIELDKLSRGRIPRDWTRQQAWTDIVWAQAAFGSKDYSTATSKAKSALLVCQDIHSIGNIAIIQDLHQQLLITPYGKERDVKELERLLNTRSDDV